MAFASLTICDALASLVIRLQESLEAARRIRFAVDVAPELASVPVFSAFWQKALTILLLRQMRAVVVTSFVRRSEVGE